MRRNQTAGRCLEGLSVGCLVDRIGLEVRVPFRPIGCPIYGSTFRTNMERITERLVKLAPFQAVLMENGKENGRFFAVPFPCRILRNGVWYEVVSTERSSIWSGQNGTDFDMERSERNGVRY